MGNPMTGFGDGVWCGGWWGCWGFKGGECPVFGKGAGGAGAPRRTEGWGSTKTRRNARAWALHRSALRASLPCPSLAFLSSPGNRRGKGNRRLRRLEPIRGRLPPADCPEWETQISQIGADLGRAGARLLIRKGEGKGKGELGGCGALPHTPAGRSSPCTPGTSATCQLARRNSAEESQTSKPLNF